MLSPPGQEIEFPQDPLKTQKTATGVSFEPHDCGDLMTYAGLQMADHWSFGALVHWHVA